MNAKGLLGQQGEQLAASFLTEAGLEILGSNWRCQQNVMQSVKMSRGLLSHL
jgi:hypothetical protein